MSPSTRGTGDSGAAPAADARVVPAQDRFTARSRSRRPGRKVVLALLALALIALGVWVVRASPLLDVRAVAVRGVGQPLAGQVEQAAAVPLGRPLAALDLTDTGRRVTAIPGVESVTVERVWPHTVRLAVTARTPVLAVSTGSGTAVRLVDRHGVTYATVPAPPSGVPVVAAAQTADGRALAGAVTMMAALPADLRATVSKVSVDSAASMSFRLGSTTIRWGDASSPELKVKVIRALLATKPQVIDVTAPQAPATS